MRLTWTVLGSLITVLALGASTYALVNAVAHEEVTETARFAAADVTALDIDNEHGSVEVIGDPRSEDIRVESRIDHGLRRTSVTAEVVDGRLVVDTDCPGFTSTWCRVDYQLSVPSDLTADIETQNGRVAVRDLDGSVTAHSSNGRIELARIGGEVEATTSNGAVTARALRSSDVLADTSNGRIELAFASAPSEVLAETSNGAIEIVVPDDDRVYRLDVDTTFTGSTDTAVRTDPTSDRLISAETSNGTVTVRYPTG